MSSSSMLRSFKMSYEKRMKKISKNKEIIDEYMILIEDNIGNLLKLHEILEDLFVEFIDIKEVAMWQKRVQNGETSVEALRKRSFMLEYGFPNNKGYIKIK